MIYRSEVVISRQQFDRINRLLDEVDFYDHSREMEDIIQELQATEDAWECGFVFDFEDGSIIFIDIRSGSANYYDDIVWQTDNDECILDCGYTLDEENEFDVGDNTYICKFIITEE